MRHPLSIGLVAAVLIAAVVSVFAAGVKTSVVGTQFYYAAPTSGAGIAVPPA
jgi:hypothetical protein